MPKTIRSRKSRYKTKNRRNPSGGKVFLFITIALIMIGAITLFSIISHKAQVKSDVETLCPKNRPISELVVLLLDLSDEFSEPQKIAVLNEIDQIKQNLYKFGKIVVFTVDNDLSRVKKPIFQLCNPGTGADMNEIYENPEIARRKWEGFSRHIDEVINTLIRSPASSSSPIFETIQSISLRVFNNINNTSVPKKTLIIVSDLIQNVPGKLNQYEDNIGFQDFEKTAYFSDIRSDLAGINVYLFYFVRPRSSQIWPDHYRFWEDYFTSQGASLESIKPIYGEK